ncbi:MAG: ABC transporter ATP-binding protein [Steroidobacteraceae bacterium]
MSIRIEQVTKHYQGTPVVNDVTLEINTGEFFVLLGPSGSGKSTLLRALAGLTHVDHGRLSLHGRDVTKLPARARGVGLVFQHYALFRHMTVAENIEFALRVRRMRAAARRTRRRELLQLVALEGYDDRYPSQLSGGQQQRVAVARALAHEPAVLLLDEPFGALDAKIRVELRETVRAVQRRLGMTTILVTHDQEEAFALADRIGVMQTGRLLETDTPETLYRFPATRFVARFLGAANLFLGRISTDGLQFGSALLPLDAAMPPASAGMEAVFIVRPEDIELGAASSAAAPHRQFARGTVRSLTFAGHQQYVGIDLEPRSNVHLAIGDAGGDGVSVDALRSAAEQDVMPLTVGAQVNLGVRRLHALPTPISSFRVIASTPAQARTLESNPLFAQLVRSMQARVMRRTGGDGASERLDAGICVLPLTTATADEVRSAVAMGARRILCLPSSPELPARMLVHARDPQKQSGALSTLVASVMRHLPVEAIAVTLQSGHAGRAEAAATQQDKSGGSAGLRGECFNGSLLEWLAQVRALPHSPLLVLDLPSTPSALDASLRGDLALLLSQQSRVPVLFAVEA